MVAACVLVCAQECGTYGRTTTDGRRDIQGLGKARDTDKLISCALGESKELR
ncbi:MAG: hypothetical protein ACI915_005574 [Gammaproteobacteria bacterium]|jgi:hypothetical protein